MVTSKERSRHPFGLTLLIPRVWVCGAEVVAHMQVIDGHEDRHQHKSDLSGIPRLTQNE